MGIRRLVAEGWPVWFEMAETVAARPEVVWEVITDWERLGDWMLEASDFKLVSEQREGLGVEAEATIKIGGIKTRDRIRVVGWEPPRRLAIAHLGWVKGTGEFHLTPMGKDRTHVFWREEFQPPLGVLGALGMTGYRPLMHRIFRRDIRALAEVIRVRV